MDRDEILELLHELGAHLAERGLRGELFLVGGAAMALAYSTRRSTADLDAVFEPKAEIYAAAAAIASARSLPATWLNDAVKSFLPGTDPNARVLFDTPGLRVTIASPRYLLAMKLLASRVERDEDDLRLLLTLTGITTVDQALDLVTDLYGNRPVEARVQYLVAALLDT
ncbi:MAG: DUF6036 family nucleotidyltransferase [Acidimicrobiia bacterium]|nr:DUF6036 family nucleotidyltransferase [Acidimicrobiia bacterium]